MKLHLQLLRNHFCKLKLIILPSFKLSSQLFSSCKPTLLNLVYLCSLWAANQPVRSIDSTGLVHWQSAYFISKSLNYEFWLIILFYFFLYNMFCSWYICYLFICLVLLCFYQHTISKLLKHTWWSSKHASHTLYLPCPYLYFIIPTDPFNL